MFALSSRACISFGPKNRSIGAAAKSQVGRVLFFLKRLIFLVYPSLRLATIRVLIMCLALVGSAYICETDLPLFACT